MLLAARPPTGWPFPYIDTTASFVYNENGLRIQKTVNGEVTNYTLHGKNVVHMTQGSNNLHFFYDASNKPAIVDFNGTKYAYVHNLQGDIVAILDSTGAGVVQYTYDAWGKPISKIGTLASTLGTVQPFRYRGYVYDEETGLYYLRSRYYIPHICRFANGDVLLSASRTLGANIICYCWNSPINNLDTNGCEGYDPQKALDYAAACTSSHGSAEYRVKSPWNLLTQYNYCTIFTSHCLEAGGLVQDEIWYTNGFKLNLIFNREYEASEAWMYTSKLRDYLVNSLCYESFTLQTVADLSNALSGNKIKPGMVIFFYTSETSIQHTMLIGDVTSTNVYMYGDSSITDAMNEADRNRSNLVKYLSEQRYYKLEIVTMGLNAN